MRDLIAPALHDLGFTGKGPRRFTYRRSDYEAVFSTQKSRYSTRETVTFMVLSGRPGQASRRVITHAAAAIATAAYPATMRNDGPAEK